MKRDDREVSFSLPGEWALKSLLGPTLGELGEDLKRLYALGRDRIFAAAFKKLRNPEDGKKANLRVARDVLWNGAFTDDEICAEYFGGVLAASRSEDGRDDGNIQFVTTIKSLSSSQLRLHYFIYVGLNQLLWRSEKRVNVALDQEIHNKKICFSTIELTRLGVRPDVDPNVLWQHGLLSIYKTTDHLVGDTALPLAIIGATTYGVLLFALVHNRLDDWKRFDQQDFGVFDGVTLPQYFAPTPETLAEKIGLKP